jgi:hypothetical protein
MVVDALSASADPLVLTGSHNWSTSAETRNDENTLILFDQDIARLYLAEFEQRYAENTVSTASMPLNSVRFWPNPAHSFVFFEGLLEEPVEIEIWSVSGQLMRRETLEGIRPISLENIPAGAYVMKLKGSHVFTSFPLQKICD